MPIVPLPQFEEDLKAYLAEKDDRDAYERLNAPTSMVVRFGAMRMVGEFPYDGDVKPGCGSKMVVRTHRGEELGEMLTSTCPNAGCSKSVTRKEMLEYIENSGGKDYPFFDAKRNNSGVKGRVLRVATKEDMDRQTTIDSDKQSLVRRARDEARVVGFEAKIVEAEEILGGGHVTYYYLAEQRIDHGAIFNRLKQLHEGERVEMRQVGARDDARLTADYERCGQYCCCKSFLKVLKPVSMRSAKVQKATLDPLKISGRCGRLMCCLRYEDQTYKDLKKNLPHRKTRVGTPHGDGIVIDSQILTQLVLIELDNRERVAVPVEELTEPGLAKAPEAPPPRERRRRPQKDRPSSRKPETGDTPASDRPESDAGTATEDAPAKKKRRRKRKKPAGERAESSTAQTDAPPGDGDAPKVVGRRRKKPAGDKPSQDSPHQNDGKPQAQGEAGEGQPKKKRRRRRGKSRGGGSPSGPSGDGGGSQNTPGGGGSDGGSPSEHG
ncbi:MAG: regulatory iron-sulfur-containing complex subunit RicT [Planctomycetota bacterium]